MIYVYDIGWIIIRFVDVKNWCICVNFFFNYLMFYINFFFVFVIYKYVSINILNLIKYFLIENCLFSNYKWNIKSIIKKEGWGWGLVVVWMFEILNCD